MKKVSIIVPIYKVEKYLNRCVESLVNQTYNNLEIILIDDGSPDECPKICDDWARKDSRIKVIHKENGGLSNARNAGMKIITGDYVCFVDSDDVVSIDMYKILIELLEKNDADMSICQYDKFSEDKEPVYTTNSKQYIFNNNDALKELFCGKKVANAVWNKLYKRELFDDIEFPEDINCGEDMYIIHRLIVKANIVAITDAKLYGYRVNREGSIMNTYSITTIDSLIKVSSSRYNDLKDNKIIIPYLNGSRAKLIYNIHTWITEEKNTDLFFSEKLLNEHKILKKVVNIKSFLPYLSGGNYKIKILRIILIVNRDLFWKIRTRERK